MRPPGGKRCYTLNLALQRVGKKRKNRSLGLYKLRMQEFDSPDKLTEKVRVLAELLLTAKHVVVHTGAGISTAAGQIANKARIT